MAEQNLVAVAAGLARTGQDRFATTYGVFATRRAYDFIAIALAHRRLNVKIVAGPARAHHRLRRHAPGDRGSGADADDPGPRRHRPVRRDRDRGGDRGDRRPSRAGLHAAAARRRAGGARRRLPLRDRQGAAAARGRGRRDHRDRADDRARARRRRRAGRRRASPPASCTSRRSSRSTPTAVAAFAASVPRLVVAENHVVAGGLASLVVEALFEQAAAAADPRRPARPLHRVRLGADPAGPLRPDGGGDRRRLPRGRCDEDHRDRDLSPSARAGRTGSSSGSIPTPASTASARARSTASSPRPRPASTSSKPSRDRPGSAADQRALEADARQRLARRRPHPPHGDRRGRGRLLGHSRQVARRADLPASRRPGPRQRARLRQRLVSHRAHARGLPRSRPQR